MKIAQFKLHDRIYLSNGPSKDDFWILAGFLTDDVGSCPSPSYKKFINDPNWTETGSNYTMMEKEGDDVRIACQFDRDFEPHIKMSQKELLSILDQWEALVKLGPKEIIIFKRGESYILEGRNSSAKE
ncbi:MAG TPA: hypothetical protein VGT41_04060 [Candidatus Babeliales bacterium]|nr:hypothetical protein [Candidatus Babeliales bacterium]